MTLDEIVKEGKTLSDLDLGMLVSALEKEYEERKDRKQMEAWNHVCDALDNYVRAYGYFTFFNGDEEFTLYRGDYAFGEAGEITINE